MWCSPIPTSLIFKKNKTYISEFKTVFSKVVRPGALWSRQERWRSSDLLLGKVTQTLSPRQASAVPQPGVGIPGAGRVFTLQEPLWGTRGCQAPEGTSPLPLPRMDRETGFPMTTWVVGWSLSKDLSPDLTSLLDCEKWYPCCDNENIKVSKEPV